MNKILLICFIVFSLCISESVAQSHISYQYNKNGELIEIRQHDNTFTFVYDSLGNHTAKIFPKSASVDCVIQLLSPEPLQIITHSNITLRWNADKYEYFDVYLGINQSWTKIRSGLHTDSLSLDLNDIFHLLQTNMLWKVVGYNNSQ